MFALEYFSPDHHCWLAPGLQSCIASTGKLRPQPRRGRGEVPGGLDEHREDDHLLQDPLTAQGLLRKARRRRRPEVEGLRKPRCDPDHQDPWWSS